jgi:hypothetical protein
MFINQPAYFQVDIPSHFCGFPDVIRGWLLKIRNLDGIHPPLKTNNGGLFRRSSEREVILKG